MCCRGAQVCEGAGRDVHHACLTEGAQGLVRGLDDDIRAAREPVPQASVLDFMEEPTDDRQGGGKDG